MLRQLLLSAAYRGFNAAMVSMEVPAADVFNQMASAVSGQPWANLKTLHPKDQAEFLKGAQQVRGMNIDVLDDTATLPEILAWLRNLHARRFLDVIAIDYLGIVNECSPQKGQTKAAAVGEVACAFKRLASELQCVLYLAVQINRGPTGDGNREPRLSDLKDSGDIEAHADRVLLLYRPDTDKTTGQTQEVHEPLSQRQRFYMQLFQEKGRNVGTGSAELWLRRELAKFELIQR
jgi:replicative DNA helicase